MGDPAPDVEAIKQLKARYFRTLDTKDWAAMRQVFTDDVVVDTSTSDGGSVVAGASHDGRLAGQRAGWQRRHQYCACPPSKWIVWPARNDAPSDAR